MPGSILAVTINSQGGSVLTFALPVGVFVVVSVALYVVFSRPHQVPGHGELAPAAGAPPDKGTAQGMAAAGPHTAAGGRGAPLPTEPREAAEATAPGEAGAATGAAEGAGPHTPAGDAPGQPIQPEETSAQPPRPDGDASRRPGSGE